MASIVDVSPNKSTTVRTSRKAPDWMRVGFEALQTLSPSLASAAAARLFFATERGRPREGERDVLTSASPFSVAHRGERIAAWSWGSGPAVLLVHGWNGRGTQLGAMVAPLLARGHRVVAFDHPAHGESTGGSTTVVEMSRAVHAVTDAIGGARGVIAHSLGAVATTLAMADGLHLERAVFVAPPVAAEPWLETLARAIGLSDAALADTQARIERRAGRPLSALRLLDLAPAMRTPLLVVHDLGDREVPFASGQALSASWPGATLLETEGLGHNRVLEAPAVVERAVRFTTDA
jgi:pimeloyl-ACP methyl ester carboxylesterase